MKMSLGQCLRDRACLCCKLLVVLMLLSVIPVLVRFHRQKCGEPISVELL